MLHGNVDDLADICEAYATPPHVIASFAAQVAAEIAAQANGLIDEISAEVAHGIIEAIDQEKVKQGMQMACCIWMTTLRLQDLLAENGELRERGLMTVDEMRSVGLGSKLHLSDVREAWQIVWSYNYRSIFGPAINALVDTLPDGAGSDILDNLADLAKRVNAERLGDHVDFTGQLFPKLLEDRSETAAFYTLPESAAILSRLAVDRIPVSEWSDLEEVKRVRVADFACGTGTLLRAAYQRVRRNFETAGGEDVRALHHSMMQESLTGTDINSLAAHMTAASLSTIEIKQKYEKTNVGSVAVRGGKTGALEFLAEQQITNETGYSEVSGADPGDWMQIHATDGEYELVIQNPPYTRARGGRKVFDIAGIDETDRRRSQKRLTQLRGWLKREHRIANGQAGMGSDFSALADKKLRVGGIFASVLPLTAAHAESWSGFRDHFTSNYSSLTAIAFASDSRESMSADTGLNEMLLVCDKIDTNVRGGGGQRRFCVSISRGVHLQLEMLGRLRGRYRR